MSKVFCSIKADEQIKLELTGNPAWPGTPAPPWKPHKWYIDIGKYDVMSLFLNAHKTISGILM